MTLAEKMYEAWGRWKSKAEQLALLPALTPAQLECLEQLVTPVWDGNLISKRGRDELVEMGLVSRWNGLNFTTQDGYVVLDALGMQDYNKFVGGLPFERRKP